MISKITITELKKSEKTVIHFIRKRLSRRWQMTREEIYKKYIAPSFYQTFPKIYIAKCGNEFVGMIIMFLEEDGYLEIKNQLWIAGLFVKKEYRSRGVGKKLVRHSESEAKENGYSRLYLDTANAEHYYRNIGGWKTLGKAFWKAGKQYLTIMEADIS